MALVTDKPLSMTEEEAQKWTSEDKYNRKVYLKEFESLEGKKYAFAFIKPNLQAMYASADLATAGKVSKAGEVILNASIVAGPVAVLEYESDIYMEVSQFVNELTGAAKKI